MELVEVGVYAGSMDRTVASFRGTGKCRCRTAVLPASPQRIALTGGPGAGKTAVLEVVRRHFCEHIVVLPEAATVLLGGGFPRAGTDEGLRAVQRAIYRVQDELERIALAEGNAAVVLCDRGVLDGLAYWPGPTPTFFEQMATTEAAALERYASVVHLRTPVSKGYDHSNPVRVESMADAVRLDARVADAWTHHPRRIFIEPDDDFVRKLTRSIEAVEAFLPACCRAHDWRGR